MVFVAERALLVQSHLWTLEYLRFGSWWAGPSLACSEACAIYSLYGVKTQLGAQLHQCIHGQDNMSSSPRFLTRLVCPLEITLRVSQTPSGSFLPQLNPPPPFQANPNLRPTCCLFITSSFKGTGRWDRPGPDPVPQAVLPLIPPCPSPAWHPPTASLGSIPLFQCNSKSDHNREAVGMSTRVVMHA